MSSQQEIAYGTAQVIEFDVYLGSHGLDGLGFGDRIAVEATDVSNSLELTARDQNGTVWRLDVAVDRHGIDILSAYKNGESVGTDPDNQPVWMDLVLQETHAKLDRGAF